MTKATLYLSHWDSKEEIFVPNDISKHLKPFQCTAVRFLYNCYQKNRGGAILNQDADMNLPLQVTAFLYVLKMFYVSGKQILICAFDEQLRHWNYSIQVHGKFTVTTDLNNDDADVILVSLSATDFKYLQKLEDKDYAVVVLDEFDRVASKLFYRNLEASFRIGLTHRSFLKVPDQKLQWKMLRWINSKEIGTFTSFSEGDNEAYKNLFQPFAEFWQRITWSFCEDNEKYTPEEKEKYETEVEKWARENNIHIKIEESKSETRKRQTQSKKVPAKNSKRKRTTKKNSSGELEKERLEIDLKNTLSKAESDDSNDTEPYKLSEAELQQSFSTIKAENNFYNTEEYKFSNTNILESIPSMNRSPISDSITESFTVKNEDQEKSEDSVLSFLFTKPIVSASEGSTADCKRDFEKADAHEESSMEIDVQSTSKKKDSCFVIKRYSREDILSELFD